MQATIHVIDDPFCGWCYAALPLLKIAAEQAKIVLHHGGLLTGSRCCYMSEEMRNYVLGHDMRIEQLTGQHFADAYVNGILKDHSFFMDSGPPIAALNAVFAEGKDDLKMLELIQIGYYIDGKSPCDIDNLSAYAAQVGVDKQDFAAAFDRASKTVDNHIQQARQLLAHIGGQGFPSFALEGQNQRYQLLAHQNYYGQTASWEKYLKQQIANLN